MNEAAIYDALVEVLRRIDRLENFCHALHKTIEAIETDYGKDMDPRPIRFFKDQLTKKT